METVTPRTEKPRRGFVRVTALCAGVIDRQGADPLAGLIQAVELLAKTEEVLASVRSHCHHGLLGDDAVPSHDLVLHDVVAWKCQLGGECCPSKIAGKLQAVGQFLRISYRLQGEGFAGHAHRRRKEGDDVRVRRSAKVRARQRKLPGVQGHTRLKCSGIERYEVFRSLHREREWVSLGSRFRCRR